MPGLTLFNSNRLETLAELLAGTLEQPLSSPFKKEVILVQSRGMQRWITLRLSETFGSWSGLTLWEVPTVFGGFLGLFLLLQTADAWSVLLAMLCLLAYLVAQDSEGVLLVIWVSNMLLVTW